MVNRHFLICGLAILLTGCGSFYESQYLSSDQIKKVDTWETEKEISHLASDKILIEPNDRLSVKNNGVTKDLASNASSKSTAKSKLTVNTYPISVGKIERRTALVIGNAQYKYSPLKNPINDARDIATSLKQVNFNVTLLTNASQEKMEDAISKFGRSLIAGGVGLFYYAGHGVQFAGQNFLIPIGAKIDRQKDVRYKAVNLGQVLDEMGFARNGLNIALLDACRDNPLPRSFRSSSRGLARVNSPEGTLIAFSTSPGSTAADGEGRNGLYTKYLLKHMKTPGISIEQVLKRVSRSVKQETDKNQTPWMESSFTGDFYFIPE